MRVVSWTIYIYMKTITTAKDPPIIRFRVLDKMWVKRLKISNYFEKENY